jgi:hypothetical protein
MLEAVIVVTFLAGVFMSLVFIAGLYKTKLKAGHEARFRNMHNATNNCSPEGSSLGWPMQSPADGHSQTLENGVRSLIDVQRFIVEGGGVSRVEVRQEFGFGATDPRHPDRKPALSRRVSWRSTTACNPAIVGLNPLDMLDKLGVKNEVASAMSGGL